MLYVSLIILGETMFLAIVILVIAIIVIIAFIFKNKQPIKKKMYKASPLMTDNEFEFFNRLVKALPDYYIFPQVSFGAILDSIGDTPQEKQRIRFTFSQKRADYVVYNDNKQIVAIIELDDRTHNVQNDAKRDAMLNEAGYRVIRFQSKQKPSVSEIAKIIYSKK
jgi:hypothetical protein